MTAFTVQLLYAPISQVRQRPLGMRRRSEFSEFPVSVAPEGSKTLFTLEERNGAVWLKPADGVAVVYTDNSSGARELRSGVGWTAGEWAFRVAFRHPTPVVSFWSLALSRLAKTLVVVFFIVQLWVMLGLQGIVLNSSVLDNSSEKLRMMKRIEELNGRINGMEADTPLKKSILLAMQEEMGARVRFLKNYENVLRRSERRKMNADCDRISEVLDILENDKGFGAEEKLDVDGSVKRILGTH